MLQGICTDLAAAISNLSEQSILSVDKKDASHFAYKLDGLLADTLREQIDVTKQDYSEYFKNIDRIMQYDDDLFEPFLGNIVNSSNILKSLILSNKINNRCLDLLNNKNKTKKQDSKDEFINKNPVFISYAHNENQEGRKHIADVVKSIRKKFEKERIKYSIDEDIEGGENFTNFERQIGKNMYKIIVFNKKYFESPHCMFEFKQIKNENINNDKKIICINSDNINLKDETVIKELYRSWTNIEVDLEFKDPARYTEVEKEIKANNYYKTDIKGLENFFRCIKNYNTGKNYRLTKKDLLHLINSVKKWFSNSKL